MLSSVSTPIIAILALVIGLLIGLLVSTLFNREPKSSNDNPLPDKLAKAGYAEGARVFYTPAQKKVVIFLDGDYYEDFAALTPEQKRRVVRLIDGMNEWGNVSPKPVVQPVTPAPAEKSIYAPLDKTGDNNLTVPVSTKPDLKMPLLPVKDGIPGLLPEKESLEDLGIDVPKIVEPIPAVVSFNLGAPPKIKEKPKTIVDQINAALDELITGTENAKKGIRLEDNGHQGVIVWVGLTRYEGVDAVTDPEIQQLIKDAVAKWEETVA